MDKQILASIRKRLRHLKRKSPKATYRERLKRYRAIEDELKALRDRIK